MDTHIGIDLTDYWHQRLVTEAEDLTAYPDLLKAPQQIIGDFIFSASVLFGKGAQI